MYIFNSCDPWVSCFVKNNNHHFEKNEHETQESQSKFHELNIYI